MLLEALIMGQPLQYMKEGHVNGCGVRLFGLVNPNKERDTEGFDVSFNLYLPGFGLIKGGGLNVTADDFAKRRTGKRKPKPKSLWLKAAGLRATQPRDGGVLQAEDPPEAAMYVTSGIESVVGLFGAIFVGKPIQVGILQHNEPVERVYYGPVALKDSEKAEIAGCIEELSAELPPGSGK
jgi:hypothetical protein